MRQTILPKGRIAQDRPFSLMKRKHGMPLISVVKTIEKSVVHPQTGEKVKRVSTLTLPMIDPKSESIIDDALLLVAGDAKLLAQVVNLAVWLHFAQQERNTLAKVDPVGKALEKTIKALQVVNPDITEDAVRAMLMSNPQFAEKMKDVKFEQFITTTVTTLPAADKFPDVTKEGGESEEAAVEEEEIEKE